MTEKLIDELIRWKMTHCEHFELNPVTQEYEMTIRECYPKGLLEKSQHWLEKKIKAWQDEAKKRFLR